VRPARYLPLIDSTADDLIELYIDPVLKANIYNSIFNSDASQSWATPQYTCISGNCTFKPVMTIAARARCHNLTGDLLTQCDDTDNCTVTVGSHYDRYSGSSPPHLSWVPGVGGQFITIFTAAEPWSDLVSRQFVSPPAESNTWNRLPVIGYIMVKDFNRVLRNFDYAGSAKKDTPSLAAECEILIGVEAVQDSIKNAEHSAEEIGFWRYGDPVTIATSNATLAAWWRNLTGQWDSAPRGDISMSRWDLVLPPGFKFGKSASEALTYFIQSIFNGTFSAGADPALWDTGVDYAAIDTIQSIFFGNFSGCAPESDDHLSCGMENMAKALTKTFRDSAYIAYGLESANVTIGETQTVVSYVRINWFWFSLPLSVWTMAAMLWISTVIHTRRMKVSAWANNILPLLFLYRSDMGKEEVRQQGTSNADYLRRSERVSVQLRSSDGKAKLE
jgi:hypothetical protein